MVKLTNIQKIIYDAIVQYKRDNDGCSPSLNTLRDMLAEQGEQMTGQAIGVWITGMPELLRRNELGNLIVIGGKWELALPQEIEINEKS